MGIAYNPRIVTDGLVLCLDAADKRSYPGTGTTWADRSTSGYDGTLTNGPTFSSANGGSVVFDGTDDYVNLNTTLSSIVSESLPATWCSTVYLNANSNNESIIGSAWAYGGFLFRKTGTSHAPSNRIRFLYFTDGGNGTGFDSADSYTNGLYNFVGVYNGSGLSYSNFKFYVNGYEAATTNPTFGSPTNVPSRTFNLGRAGVESTAYWSGKIHSVQIYNRTLSADEILQNYNATKGRFNV